MWNLAILSQSQEKIWSARRGPEDSLVYGTKVSGPNGQNGITYGTLDKLLNLTPTCRAR